MQKMRTLVPIQCLRAVAAIGVLFDHADFVLERQTGIVNAIPGAKLGLAGVDLFFVISGFIMVYTSRPLFAQPRAQLTFLRKRIARIVPLYWSVTTVYVLLALALPRLAKSFPPDVVATSYFFIPWPRPEGDMQPIVGQGWTLNYEMAFYLLFAVALTWRREVAVIVLSTAMTAAVILAALAPPASLAGQYWADPIILEFILGMVIGLAYESGLRITTTQTIVVAAIGVAGLLAFGPTSSATVEFRPLMWGLPAAVIVAALVLHDGAGQPEKVASVATKLWLVLGAASYSIYLLHVLIMRAIVAFAAPALTLPPWLLAVLMIMASTAVGILANRGGLAAAGWMQSAKPCRRSDASALRGAVAGQGRLATEQAVSKRAGT
jgi:exopolysaccharide production protein ExoZ